MKSTSTVGTSVVESEIIHLFQVQGNAIAREIALFAYGSIRRDGSKDVLHSRRRCTG